LELKPVAANRSRQQLTDSPQADGEGNRALHWAVLQGAQAGVECLVAEGAHVDARGKGGRTALHHAVASKQLNIIRTLHCLRAQLELRDDLQVRVRRDRLSATGELGYRWVRGAEG
jgi:ankyrin repeat protein